jgi:hypothetical protein
LPSHVVDAVSDALDQEALSDLSSSTIVTVSFEGPR